MEQGGDDVSNEIVVTTEIDVEQYLRTHQEMSLSTHEELHLLPHMFKILPVVITAERPQAIVIEVII